MKTDDIKVTPQWRKNKEEIWAAEFAGLEDKPPAGTSALRRRRIIWYATAAVIAAFIALPSISLFYSKVITAPRGEHMSVTLPDGSTAELNAESHIKFNTLRWKNARKVEVSGEVYFEVVPGSRFTVESSHGKVTVLGTSFNVYDRKGSYNVSCFSGKVEVSAADESMILTSGMSARYENNNLTAHDNPHAGQSADWISGRFSFDSAPLREVIAEIERQYDIKVAVPANMDYLYTGHFAKTQSPEQVLEIIGKPFGIKFKIE